MTIYKLNGVEVFLRLENGFYEVRLFEDNKQGHVVKASESKGLGAVLDMAYSEIQERISKPLHNIETKGEYFLWKEGQGLHVTDKKECVCNGTGIVRGRYGIRAYCKCKLGEIVYNKDRENLKEE